MPDSPLVAAGAAVQPVAAAPLNTNRFFTGVWTNRSPLRDAATPYLYEKFYSASRYDSIIRGGDMELTTRLTLKLRAGNDVYNSSLFPPINRLYENRTIINNAENVQLLASCDQHLSGGVLPTVRDATGPTTNNILWTKNLLAGRTSFLTVGNACYFSDGVDSKKLLTSGITWEANKAFAAGQWIVDPNGNIQESLGAQVAKIVNIQVFTIPSDPTYHTSISMFFDPTTPLTIAQGSSLTFAGLTTVPALNGTTAVITFVNSSLEVSFNLTASIAAIVFSPETGTATTGAGTSGATPPAWLTAFGAVTLDGTLQWVNRGPNVQDWQPAAPTTAPTVTQAPAPVIYPQWAAGFYGPAFIVEDANLNLQKLNVSGTTGATAPTFPTSPPGAVTTDGTVTWTLLASPVWQASHSYIVGDILRATFTYYITPVPGKPPVSITTTCIFQCIVAGISGGIEPKWVNGTGTNTRDGGATWLNLMPKALYAQLTPSKPVFIAPAILDDNGNIQKANLLATTGATKPTTWATDLGAYTLDGAQTWINAGAFGAANTGAWIYAYSYQNDIDKATSTASPKSIPIAASPGNLIVIQGQGSGDPQVSNVILWRTVQNGSTLLYLDTIPNPGAGQSWVYTDATPDSGLNEFITAPISSSAGPPPAGFIVSGYHLGRVWGFVGATLYYSQGPDATPFNGATAFSPGNSFPLQAKGIKVWPTSIGLIVFTTNGSWIILGQGTQNSPLYIVPYQDDIAITSPDCFVNQGSTGFLMDATKRVLSLDPGAGELEIGFPIADQFEDNYDPQNTWFAWHRGGSSDTALFVANGSNGWWRMAAIAAPESGQLWSPPANIGQGGVKAIVSMETAPGIRSLILGPAVNGSPILKRNPKINNDAGVFYGGYVDFGSIVIAQPGTQAAVQYITVETSEESERPDVGVLMDEVKETATKTFQMLRNTCNDPPNQEPSETVPSTRFFAMQSAKSIQGRHVQVRILFEPKDAPNELFSYTIYGRLPEKARK